MLTRDKNDNWNRGGSSRKISGCLILEGVHCRPSKNTTAQQLRDNLHCGS